MTKEQFDQLHSLVTEWRGKEGHNVPAHVISEMFTLNNLEFPHEYSKSCGGCRQRVWTNLKNFYDAHKSNFGY
jgi:hypothetical protein